MRRGRWGGIAVGLVVVAMELWLCGDRPSTGPEIDSFWHAVSSYRTLYESVGLGVLRVDASVPAFTLDLTGHPVTGLVGIPYRLRKRGVTGRLSWNGHELYWAPTGQAPVLLPDVYEERVAEVWAHLRLGTGEGFTLTPASEEELPVGVVRGRPARVPYIVDTPFDWHDDWRILVWVENGNAMAFGVTDLAGEPLRVGGYVLGQVPFSPAAWRIIRDVPLDPDLLEPWAPEHPDQHRIQDPLFQVRAIHGEIRLRHWTDGMFHDNVRRVWFESETQSGATANQAYLSSCDDGPARNHQPIHTVWRVPTDGDASARLFAAQAECAEVRFHAGIRGWVESFGPHVEACVEGTWQLQSTATEPPTVLWMQDIDLCHRDTSEGVPLFHDATMPRSADLSKLELVFAGSASVECLGEGQRGGRAILRQTTFRIQSDQRVHAPVMWWDCYPGWDPASPG